jgi:membrane-bound serine protease (ClpP class)
MTFIITLLVVGAILLFLETLLPGMVAGVAGFVCWIGAVVYGYGEYGAGTGNLTLAAVVAGSVAGIYCWLKFFPESRMAGLFISHKTVGNLGVEKPELLNLTGVAISQLRPSGTAFINGKRVDVVTEGALIDRGASIKVVAIEGIRVVVREV